MRHFIMLYKNAHFFYFSELLISLPLSVFLPTIKRKDFARAKHPMNENKEKTTTKRTRNNNEYNEIRPQFFNSNQLIESRTTTMQQMLDVIGIDREDAECQQHFICQLMKQPNRFAPLSTFVYLILR